MKSRPTLEALHDRSVFLGPPATGLDQYPFRGQGREPVAPPRGADLLGRGEPLRKSAGVGLPSRQDSVQGDDLLFLQHAFDAWVDDAIVLPHFATDDDLPSADEQVAQFL